jgi:hypothetical protein
MKRTPPWYTVNVTAASRKNHIFITSLASTELKMRILLALNGLREPKAQYMPWPADK